MSVLILVKALLSNKIIPQVESLLLSPMPANQDLTHFLCKVLPEKEGRKEGLGQPVSTCLLSTLPNQTPGLPCASYKEGYPALTYQQVRALWSIKISCPVKLFRAPFYQLDGMLLDS